MPQLIKSMMIFEVPRVFAISHRSFKDVVWLTEMYTKVAIAKKNLKYNIYIWNQHYVCWLTLLDAIVSEGLVMTRLGSLSSIIYAGAIWVYNFLPFSFILWYARIKFRFIVFFFFFYFIMDLPYNTVHHTTKFPWNEQKLAEQFQFGLFGDGRRAALTDGRTNEWLDAWNHQNTHLVSSIRALNYRWDTLITDSHGNQII